MKIENLAFVPANRSVPPVTFQLTASLNVVDAQDLRRCQQICDLVGHVLYGARVGNDLLASESDPTGYIDVSNPGGKFRLERHADRVDRGSFTEPRLTIAPLDSQTVRPRAARDLLGGMMPETAARLMVLRSADHSQLDWLLSETLAGELCRLEKAGHRSATSDPATATSDALFSQRDRLSHQIEVLLADKRRSSEALEAALDSLTREKKTTEHRLAEYRRELNATLAELAELETQLRYHELADFVGRASDEAYHSDQQPTLEGLDEEIAKWRRVMVDLEAREAQVRRQLAQLHPDDSSPLLPLADQRAAVSVAQRLVADLDSEVARYARPSDSTECLCHHTHARLHPLIETLGQHVGKLARLTEQYEAAIESEQLKAEAKHLARSQAELSATIEHLLDRRQSRLRTSRVRRSAPGGQGSPADWQRRHAILEQQRDQLTASVREVERHLAELAARRDRLHRNRADLMNDQSLASLRQQLDDVVHRINQGQSATSHTPYSTAPWRASDILAKLTDGRLREVRLTNAGREAAVADRQGTLLSQAELTDVDRRLLAISLQLAAVAGAAKWGMELPLLVADPFAQLPASEASTLALVLHDFARSGHQVLLATASQGVVNRLRAIGQTILMLSPGEQVSHLPTVEPVSKPAHPPAAISLHEGDCFALKLDEPVKRFRVFGDDTADLFAAVGIRTIGELLDADADDLSQALDRTGVSSSIVELWQIHVAMLVFVPNLTLDDVQLLTGAGVQTPKQLAEAAAEVLYQSICEYLDSPRGVRHRALGTGLSQRRIRHWIADAQRELDCWMASTYASRWSRRSRANGKTARPRRNGAGKRGRQSGNGKRRRPLRFRLSRTSPVVDAPSIGPKTAKRLAKVGVKTVADLLAADAAATAESLGNSRISAETIVAWQHQAQLMCRVPELLARDTQVLVGCGFTTPEDIAGADAADLLEFAKSYTSTPEGTRVLRGSDPPDLARVTKWVYWAEHRRTLEAA